MRAFIDEYSAARRRPLSRAERERIAGCATFIAAYTARCEHALHGRADSVANTNMFSAALKLHGDDYLRA